MTSLSIMVAPNGARRGHADHPNLPVTIDEIACDAVECHSAGVQAVHLHVRDDEGRHCIDASRYLAAIDAVRHLAGYELIVQMTTERWGNSHLRNRSRRFARSVPRPSALR